ncbi:MAG: hypothetical protein ACI9FG_001153 [Crocinitomicaceae bacterium]|jgi:hypothetical protein
MEYFVLEVTFQRGMSNLPYAEILEGVSSICTVPLVVNSTVGECSV